MDETDSPFIIEHLNPAMINSRRLVQFFQVMDEIYIPRVSQLVNIEEYVKKLTVYADIFVARANEIDAGLCAVYINRPPTAFITSLGILPTFQGRGMAHALLEISIKYALKNGYKAIELQVDKRNIPAKRLYQSIGFVTVQNGNTLLMRKEL